MNVYEQRRPAGICFSETDKIKKPARYITLTVYKNKNGAHSETSHVSLKRNATMTVSDTPTWIPDEATLNAIHLSPPQAVLLPN